jgi:hypothetical protein
MPRMTQDQSIPSVSLYIRLAGPNGPAATSASIVAGLRLRAASTAFIFTKTENANGPQWAPILTLRPPHA